VNADYCHHYLQNAVYSCSGADGKQKQPGFWFPQWLLGNGTREQLIAWLVWNDRNGIYTDRDSEAEGYPPLTLETARAAMRRVLNPYHETLETLERK
jgi:hypothetical protein